MVPLVILVVEDERIVGFDLQQQLQGLGYSVPLVVASGEEALEKAGALKPDCVLMDIRIEGALDGIETAERLAEISSVPVVYLTAHSEEGTLARARKTLPYGYLLKPFDEREIHATLQMAVERHRHEAEMRRATERLHIALDAASMGVVDMDLAAGNVELGARAAELLGFDRQQRSTTFDSMLAQVDDEHRERVAAELHTCQADDATCAVEFTRQDVDGTLRWLRADGRGVDGDPTGRRVLGVLQDITVKKQQQRTSQQMNETLERTVRLRTAELQASLEELGSFSYSVAHDLRAPLRAVNGFADRLLEDCAGGLSPECRHYVERVHAAGQKMAAVTEALLSLARLNRVEVRREQFDVSAFVRDELRTLRDEQPDRLVDVVVQDDIVAFADPALLRIVLDNLLRNAWKYTSRHPTARIEFGCVASPKGPEYFVRDDGAGFDSMYTSQLFAPFRRLHLAKEFEGIGVGLATVQRIVQRHGGSVKARGETEKGATFMFTLGEAAGR